jgi:hypothetical protein
VQLSDGSTVSVLRVTRFSRLSGLDRDQVGWNAELERLVVNGPAGEQVLPWQSLTSTPYFFDRFQGHYWIVVAANQCKEGSEWLNLWTPYRFDGREWVRGAPDGVPTELIPNLLLDQGNREVTSQLDHVNLALKRRLNEESGVGPPYRKINLDSERRC